MLPRFLSSKSSDLEQGSLSQVRSGDQTLNEGPGVELERVNHRTIPGRAVDSVLAAIRPPPQSSPRDVVPGHFRTLSITVTETRNYPDTPASNDKKKQKHVKDLSELEWHAISINEILNRCSTSLQNGLSANQAQRRLAQDGKNLIPPPPLNWPRLAAKAVFGGFGSILIGGFILCFLTWRPIGDPNPSTANLALAVVILIVVILQSGFNAWQDFSTSRIMASIKDMLPSTILVLRDGQMAEIASSELVVGDIISIKMGCKVPADARIVQASDDFAFDRSVLTGESDSIPAFSAAKPDDIFMEASNIALQGTLCVSGTGLAVVVGTGGSTVFGRIAAMAAKSKNNKTTLEIEVTRFVFMICSFAAFTAITIVILWAAWLRRDHPDFISVPTLLIDVVSVGIAFIPEGLPISVTMTLSVIARKMKANNIICKSLTTVETLGAINVLCSDKTGTLTTNKMVVTDFGILHEEDNWKQYAVQDLDQEGAEIIHKRSSFRELITVAAVCNDAEIESYSVQGAKDEKDQNNQDELKIKGDASDTALVKFVAKFQDLYTARNLWNTVGELPFNSRNKFALKLSFQKIHSNEMDTSLTVMCKGAPDILLDRCKSVVDPTGNIVPLTDSLKHKLTEMQTSMASQGQRVLLLTYKKLSEDESKELCVFHKGEAPSLKTLTEEQYIEQAQDLCVIGVVGLVDPPREDTLSTVLQCRTAGVRFVMVTGDFPVTALAIARSVQIVTHEPQDVHTVNHIKSTAEYENSTDHRLYEEQNKEVLEDAPTKSIVISGKELAALDDEELKRVVAYDEIVFARMSPDQKLRIVKAFQETGNCVGMTGDGVNDAPSLKQADIGIAMGNGSAVAMESANLILMENFSAIVKGIELGRLVFENLKKVIIYLIPAGSWSELMPVIISVVFGLPQALSALQMIIICVGTDIFPAMSIIHEGPEENLLLRKPRNLKTDRLANWKLFFHAYVFVGTTEALLAMIGAFYWGFTRHGIKFSQLWLAYGDYGDLDVDKVNEATYISQSIYFVTLVMLQWGSLLGIRTRRRSIFQQPPYKNPRLLIAMPIALCIAIFFLYVPFFQNTFQTRPVPAYIYFLSLAYALGILFLDEMRKYFVRTRPNGIFAKLAW